MPHWSLFRDIGPIINCFAVKCGMFICRYFEDGYLGSLRSPLRMGTQSEGRPTRRQWESSMHGRYDSSQFKESDPKRGRSSSSRGRAPRGYPRGNSRYVIDRSGGRDEDLRFRLDRKGNQGSPRSLRMRNVEATEKNDDARLVV